MTGEVLPSTANPQNRREHRLWLPKGKIYQGLSPKEIWRAKGNLEVGEDFCHHYHQNYDHHNHDYCHLYLILPFAQDVVFYVWKKYDWVGIGSAKIYASLVMMRECVKSSWQSWKHKNTNWFIKWTFQTLCSLFKIGLFLVTAAAAAPLLRQQLK